MFSALLHEGEIVRTPRGFLAQVLDVRADGWIELLYVEGPLVGQRVTLRPGILRYVAGQALSTLPMKGE